jgi:hypothetical protein
MRSSLRYAHLNFKILDFDQSEFAMIVFSKLKDRKHYVQYQPNDTLEAYMVQKNNRELAVSYPTHVSQRGGYYNLEDTNAVLLQWYITVYKKEEFYMEEARGTIFKLHLDIDIKSTVKEPFSIVDSGLLSHIQEFVTMFFQVSNVCLVTECHGDWTDSEIISAVYKSGFRLYFLQIYVGVRTFGKFVESLTVHLNKKFPSYKNQPKDWKMTDVIDKEVILHDRARMFGSTKWRRGKILGRVYKMNGVYFDGKIKEKSTKYLETHLYLLLQFTLINMDNSKGEFYHSYPIYIINSGSIQESVAYVTHPGNVSNGDDDDLVKPSKEEEWEMF